MYNYVRCPNSSILYQISSFVRLAAVQLPPKQLSSAYGRDWKAGQYPERTSIISCFLYISFKTNVSSNKIDQIHQKEDAEPCEEIQQIHPAAFQKHAV